MNDHPVVIVTGASRGVGAAVVQWLGKQKVNVTLVARSKDSLEKVASDVERLGGVALALTADIADQKACSKAVDDTFDRFGRIDGLVNNVGLVEPLGTVAVADPTIWQYSIGVNLLGPFYLARAVLPELRKREGRIINVSSGAADIPIQAASAYCAAKAGLTHFTRVLAAEEPSITAIAVRPGVVGTDMQNQLRRQAPLTMPPSQADYYERLKVEGELEPPHVPARSIAWLSLFAPNEWSGKYMDYDDPIIAQPALERFGEEL